MPWLLFLPMAALVLGAGAVAWSALVVERQLAALRTELAATATLQSAHRVLRHEIDGARRRRAELDGPAESWGPGGAR